ncbi:MAG: phosphatidylglycerophosphatase A [Bacteroidota bacterium]|nr:phosphatidylglycerophosphatase A [Bacteroidota bacterium]
MQSSKNIPFTARIIATGLFTGYSPIAPGTAGSALGLTIFFISGVGDTYFFIPLIIITFFIGVLTSSILEKSLGSDPSVVVIDEIVGMWISLLFLPSNLIIMISAFLLFRIFDIVKPFPCRRAEKLKLGWGIMLDDVIAGIYANLLLQIAVLVL